MTKYRVTFWYCAKYQRDIEANSPEEAFYKIQDQMLETDISKWELCPDEVDHEILAYADNGDLIFKEIEID